MAHRSIFPIPPDAVMLYGLKEAAAVLDVSASNLSNRIRRNVERQLPPPRFVLASSHAPLWTAAELQAVAADRAARIATAAEGLRETSQ